MIHLELLNTFKIIYQKQSAANPFISFDEVYQAMADHLNMEEAWLKNKFDHGPIFRWYQFIHHQEYLLKPILSLPIMPEEIIIHSPTHWQIIDKKIHPTLIIDHIANGDYQLLLENWAVQNHWEWNFSIPFISQFFEVNQFKFRVTMIHYSISSDNISKVFIRSIKTETQHIDSYQNPLLSPLIFNRENILIAGSTGSGKTTLMRSMLNIANDKDHLVVIEDTAEIGTVKINQTNLIAKNNTVNKTLADYCAYAMRLRPDRLILGEMRGIEVVAFLLMMNTGHRGLMSTIHANSAIDAIHRVALLFTLYSNGGEVPYDMVVKLICKCIDYVVFVENHQVKEIIKLLGSENGMPYFETMGKNS